MAIDLRRKIEKYLVTLNYLDCVEYGTIAKYCGVVDNKLFRGEIQYAAERCGVGYLTEINYGILVVSSVNMRDGVVGLLRPKIRWGLPEYRALKKSDRNTRMVDIKKIGNYLLSVPPGTLLCHHMISMATGILLNETGLKRMADAIKMMDIEVDRCVNCIRIVSDISKDIELNKLDPVIEMDESDLVDEPIQKELANCPRKMSWQSVCKYLDKKMQAGIGSHIQIDPGVGTIWDLVGCQNGDVQWKLVGTLDREMMKPEDVCL